MAPRSTKHGLVLPPPSEQQITAVIAALRKDAGTWDEACDELREAAAVAAPWVSGLSETSGS
jgi:hypothetical protein